MHSHAPSALPSPAAALASAIFEIQFYCFQFIVFSVAFLQFFLVFCSPCAVEVLPAQHLRASSKDSRGMFSFRVRRAQPGRTSGFFDKKCTCHSAFKLDSQACSPWSLLAIYRRFF